MHGTLGAEEVKKQTRDDGGMEAERREGIGPVSQHYSEHGQQRQSERLTKTLHTTWKLPSRNWYTSFDFFRFFFPLCTKGQKVLLFATKCPCPPLDAQQGRGQGSGSVNHL